MKTIIKNTAVPALAILLHAGLGTTAFADRVIWERDQPQRGVSADFDRQSSIAPNPRDRQGRFQFDLEIMQTVHRGGEQVVLDWEDVESNFEIRLAVNSRDGSMAIYEPMELMRQWNDALLEYFRPDFIFLHTDGTGFVCGEHVEYGPINIAVEEMLQLDGDDWIVSPANNARIPATAEPVEVGNTQRRFLGAIYNRANLAKLRGTLASGHSFTLWHDGTLSPVATQVPWLGMGVGLYKDPHARVNRVALQVRYGGDDGAPATVVQLRHIHRKHQQFDTEGYNLITAFLFSAIDQALDMRGKMEGLGFREGVLKDHLEALHPEDSHGREIIDRMLDDLDHEKKQQVQDFIQQHGLDQLGISAF